MPLPPLPFPPSAVDDRGEDRSGQKMTPRENEGADEDEGGANSTLPPSLVYISAQARRLFQMDQAVALSAAKIPFDEHRVNDLRYQLASHTYRPDPKAIADFLLKESVEMGSILP